MGMRMRLKKTQVTRCKEQSAGRRFTMCEAAAVEYDSERDNDSE